MTNGRRANAAGRPPTLRDVAALAAVNPSVVSRVLNRDPTLKITDATRERVLDAVTRLSYRPNALARGLRMSTTSALGLVLPEVANPVYGPIVVGAERRATEAGYVLVLGSGLDAASTEASFARLLDEGRVDGLLVASATVEDELLRTLAAGSAPVIAVNRRISGAVGSVIVDDAAAARIATEHLLELGHRRIMHIAGPPSMDTTQRRQQGYEAAMTAAGLPSLVVGGEGWDAASGYRVARGALGDDTVSAVFVANVMSAIGVIRAAREHGRVIPDDMSVVCLHESPVAEYFDPSLTTVALPLEELGRAAVELVLDRLAGGVARDVLLSDLPQLLVRGSTRRFDIA